MTPVDEKQGHTMVDADSEASTKLKHPEHLLRPEFRARICTIRDSRNRHETASSVGIGTRHVGRQAEHSERYIFTEAMRRHHPARQFGGQVGPLSLIARFDSGLDQCGSRDNLRHRRGNVG